MSTVANPAPSDSRRSSAFSSTVRILGVEITDIHVDEALALLTSMVEHDGPTKTLYFVNTHTLNCSAEDPSFRDVLNSADVVFGDGTGVRWGARMHGVRIKDNLNGTDLIPKFLDATSGRGLRYFLLGSTEDTIARAAAHCQARYPGWELAGYHHGYVLDTPIEPVLAQIEEARPQLLLVGMGNPHQERFIHDHRDALSVPLAVGVGGLVDHFAGNLERAPRWLRDIGFEWVQTMLQQPHKARRYLVGNPLYLYRVARERVGL